MQKVYKKVRLSKDVIDEIINLSKKYFGQNCRVWIFGSRADLTKKGGDIDIYIETPEYKNILDKKLDFLVELDKKIGEQKVDLVIKPLDSQNYISQEAKSTGIRIY
ncbi:nucleotidyltransferase domain-containing protein [Persephonella sp.]|uniref:nucleotidyltransferase domain-containing protein n=1 Tax=Persephonella sp. TaxID=2060922 RepID=UPI0026217FFC|nr:nucleotidyltransferase domain-containing protein [Persephonella sp.]